MNTINLRNKRKRWAAIGDDKDQFVPLSLVRGTRDSLAAKGFPVELSELPNHDYRYANVASNLNRSAWQFFSKHELAAEPKYETLQVDAIVRTS